MIKTYTRNYADLTKFNGNTQTLDAVFSTFLYFPFAFWIQNFNLLFPHTDPSSPRSSRPYSCLRDFLRYSYNIWVVVDYAFHNAVYALTRTLPACATITLNAGSKSGKVTGIAACVNQWEIVEAALILQDACVQTIVWPGCLKIKKRTSLNGRILFQHEKCLMGRGWNRTHDLWFGGLESNMLHQQTKGRKSYRGQSILHLPGVVTLRVTAAKTRAPELKTIIST